MELGLQPQSRPLHSPKHQSRSSGKERDSETQLDYFGARYFGSSMGRFTTPDEFWKDSDVADPQSWNKYAYGRNNPLRFTDPTGEKATVTTKCSSDGKTCTVNISASVSIYARNGTTDKQMNAAKAAIKSQIEKAWKGTFKQNGVTYNVSTSVSVEVAASESAAMKSGAQNVVGIDASGTAKSEIKSNWTGRGPDTGTWDYGTVTTGGLAPHEFSHILGLDDNHGDVLSNAFSTRALRDNPEAAGQDFQWAIGPELQSGQKNFTIGSPGVTRFGMGRGNRHWWESSEKQKDND